MVDDLHRSIWFTYRSAIGADASWDARAAFQAALDAYLVRCPALDAASACNEVARMIMMRPRGVGNRGRIVVGAPAAVPCAAVRARSVAAFGRVRPPRSALSMRA